MEPGHYRAIQKYLEDPLAEVILALQVQEGDIMIADFDSENSKIIFEYRRKEMKTEA